MNEGIEILQEQVNKLTENKDIVLAEETKEVIDSVKTDDEVLVIDEWDMDFEEKFPLIHVATLSGKKVYTRRMTLNDKSNFVNAMKKLKNDLEFTAYAIAEMALDEEGNKIYKTENQKASILKKKPEEILALYLCLYKVAEPGEYLKYIENKNK